MNPEDAQSRRRFLGWGAATLTLLAGCTGAASSLDQEENTTTGDGSTTGADCSTPGATDENTETSEEVTQSETGSASVRLGEVVAGDNVSMVARETRTTESLGEFTNAEDGNEFVVVRMAVKNTSGQYVDFNSFWQSRLKDAQNRVYDPSISSTDTPIQSGVLAAGEVARGDVVYEVPQDAEGLTMQFDFTAFDLFEFDRVTVDISTPAESIADLCQSLAVDVHAPGETASYEDVSVTLHGVRSETSLGQFTEAEEGTEYVIPDFEITNDTSEPLTVSTLLQMRVKDETGLAYSSDISGSSSLDRSYSEGSDIAPGESRRGELAYQVPTDEQSLYWVFNFLDITDPSKAFWEL